MEKLFTLARELATPKAWSAGVELARNADFQRHGTGSASAEQTVRIVQGPRDKVISVTLSEEDEVWQCDCGSDEDPCSHVVATILACKQNKVSSELPRRGAGRGGSLVHAFTRVGNSLTFRRYLLFGEERVVVQGTLVGALEQLRTQQRYVSPSDEELRIDYVLPAQRDGTVDARTMRSLIPALSRVRGLELNGSPIIASSEPLTISVEVIDEAEGYRVRRYSEADVEHYFDNGVAICAGRLCAIEDSSLRMEDLVMLQGEGTFFPATRELELATRVLPMLQSKVKVHVRTRRLPRARKISPRIVLEALADDAVRSLTIVPHLVYGDPVIAEIKHGSLQLRSRQEIPIRDPVAESQVIRDLGTKLGLKIDEARVFSGEHAVLMAARVRGWSVSGAGVTAFTPLSGITPVAEFRDGQLAVSFQSEGGGEIAADALADAWRRGQAHIRLDHGGGWAELPRQWLAQHGEALERILAAQQATHALPARLVSEVEELCQSIGVSPPEYFARLRTGLSAVETIPDARLPDDLTASLRSYQRVGINWIQFLHRHGLGALLADDMGLGKTLQALCCVRGRTLVVCPTSVLSSWHEQISRFRPSLRVQVYHGARRTLDSDSDVTLTSYALLRLDRERLCEHHWETLVLDESQTIRNPHSQVARAAFALNATNRISLSGTPVENSLEDLWSQFRLLNPGLLGEYNEFSERFVGPIGDGDLSRTKELQARVKPFILRRLKREVAKELPPKTEVVLQCELEQNERIVYDALLGAARGELLARLEQGDGVFSILEALLRLRQACCHIGLLPGHDATTSSKLELLMDALERSADQGHRALVFSQWTSLLDKIEPHLTRRAITFSRIDGSTKERGEVVEKFQCEDGPRVMLLSLKAGGLGLTLTRADHVYIVDPWWNPAVEDQAADRAYRIGQENPVLVHRLVAKDTIEERVLELQASKRALLASALGEEGGVSLTREELLQLLEA
jgi:hypothetical protein